MSEWRAVVSFAGVYEVSDFGRVRRIKAGRGATAGKILTPRVSAKGYLRVILHDGDHVEELSVHRAVALAFLPCSTPASLQVNHLDGNPANNVVDNLEWVTGAANLQHSYSILGRQPRSGESNGRARLTGSQVAEIRALRGVASGRAVAEQYGVSNQLIGMIWRREIWKTVA